MILFTYVLVSRVCDFSYMDQGHYIQMEPELWEENVGGDLLQVVPTISNVSCGSVPNKCSWDLPWPHPIAFLNSSPQDLYNPYFQELWTNAT
jgi:hypothetical protein